MRVIPILLFSILILIPLTAYSQTVPTSSKALLVDGTNLSVHYKISGGELLGAIPDTDAMSLILSVQMTDAGQLEITLPRELIDSKIGQEDDIYFVLVDADEVDFSETKTQTDRTLTISIPAGSDEVEIIGTKVIPEFPLAIAIMIVSMISIVFVTKFKTFSSGFSIK